MTQEHLSRPSWSLLPSHLSDALLTSGGQQPHDEQMCTIIAAHRDDIDIYTFSPGLYKSAWQLQPAV